MGRFTLCVKDKDEQRWYLCWSTIVDGAVALTSDRQKYRNFLINDSRLTPYEADEQIQAAEERGVSSRGYRSAEEVLRFVRDGNGTHFSLAPAEAVAHYLKQIESG